MKKLEYYEKDLKTCSKCGLCQSVCPVYKATGKETIVSRGKFNLLLGLLKGDLKYTKKLDETLSMCLHCKACDDFCPSSIKASEIIRAAKNENKKFCGILKYTPFFKIKMLFLSLLFKAYRFSRLSKFVPFFEDFIRKFGILGKYFLLFDKISKINVKRKKTTQQNTKKTKVIYFEGCFTKYLNPGVKNAVLNFFEKNDIEVIQKKFECCGISALYSGDFKQFKHLKEKNVKLLKDDCDYIVCDCATCLSALKEYSEDFSYKIIDISALIESFSKKLPAEKATYHLPCHLRDEKEKILAKVENIVGENYLKMNDCEVCCGFSGDFSIRFPIISKFISEEKSKNIEQTRADFVLTSCPGCVIGLNKGLIESQSNKRVLNLIEYFELNS